MQDTRPIVIISTGRTGTIFLSKLFGDLYPQAASYHERGLSRPIQILTNIHFAHLLPKSWLKAAWQLLKGKEIETCRKPFHIDSNCFLYGLVALAPELYPANLKVIHIVRDPRSYVTSHLNFALQKPTSFIGNYLTPFWQPNPFLVGEIPWREFLHFSRFERYCWIWGFKNRVMASLEKTDTSYLRIRFEDIFNNESSETVFTKITDFISLPPAQQIAERFREPLNAAAKTNLQDWQYWSSRQCSLLQSLCGELMQRFGYGSEPEWTQKLAASA